MDNRTLPDEVRPRVSILIPVWNKVALTRACLDALRRHTPAGLFEVIVWDNGSTDGTQEFLRGCSAEDSALRWFRSEENLGFVGGNNAAAEHARGEYLVFLNNDTEPRAGWLEALLEAMEADDRVGAVGAKLIYPDGRLQEAGGIVFRDASGWNYGRLQDPRDPRYNFPREVDYCSAACLLTRATLFKELGGFDVRYAPAYYEDTDYCFALRERGFRVMYEPRCEIVHHEGATAGQDLKQGLKQYQVVNGKKFAEKWNSALQRQSRPSPSVVRLASHRVRGQRILIIDPLLPMYDRASGSKRLFEVVRMLVAGGHAVTFIARNGVDSERYAPELQRLGVEVYAGDPERMRECGYVSKAWPLDLRRLLQDSAYDTIVLSFWYIAEQYLGRIRSWSPGSRVVIDTVDVHYVREQRQAELYNRPDLLRQAADTQRRELGVYRQADALVVVTEDDGQALLRQVPGVPVFVVPNIHKVVHDVPPVDGRDGLLFVGGFAHPPNVDAVLYFHQAIWPGIKQRVPNAHWTIVGNNPPPAILSLAGPSITVTGYVPDLLPYLQSHLISVAPLRYGAGMKGKIGEALAHGLPVLTTTIGAEGMGLGAEGSGALVADDPEMFADLVARLYGDRALWGRLSATGRRHMEARFSPEAVTRPLDALLTWSASVRSVVILAHNQWSHTVHCLDSLQRNTTEPLQVVAVDNGSTDETVTSLWKRSAEQASLQVIRNATNRGFAAGNNQALSIARGEYVVLLNNDTVVTPGWLDRMIAVLERRPEVGLVGPMTNRASGPQVVEKVGYEKLEDLDAFAERWAAEHAGQTEDVGRLVGFCLVMRRAVVEAIGGLDETFGSGNFEDDDLCIRAALAGFKACIAKDVFIHHAGSQTFKGEKIDYRQAMLTNWKKFKAKWGLAANAPIEHGYRMPTRLPAGVSLRVPLPRLEAGHRPDATRRCWTDLALLKKDKVSTADLPAVARVGSLEGARQRVERQEPREAWEMAIQAIGVRPCHPEAWCLLGEIARERGDHAMARECAERAHALAPGWKRAKKLLKALPRGGATRKVEWMVLPEGPIGQRGEGREERGEGGAGRESAHAELWAPSSAFRNRLTVCVIAKNEEKFLPKCLQSVQDLAWQMVVLDTGSTDRTVEVAKELGAEVHTFEWCDDFSAAKNAALEHARGDWVLFLDADEELSPEARETLPEELADRRFMAYRMPLRNEGCGETGHTYVPRLFRNAPGVHFVGRVDEQPFASVDRIRKEWGLESGPGKSLIVHHGYEKEVVAGRQKGERNLRLLELAVEEMPDDPNLHMNLGMELGRAGRMDEGLERYRVALQMIEALPPSTVLPEFRECLLSRYAMTLLEARRHGEVLDLLETPLAKGVALNAAVHYAAGMAALHLQRHELAIEQLQLCLERRARPSHFPLTQVVTSSSPVQALGLAYAQAKRSGEAEATFRNALKDSPKDSALRYSLARTLWSQDKAVPALETLHALIADQADHRDAWVLGGRIALSHPDYLEFASDWTGEAIKHLPGEVDLQALRAETLMLRGELAGAVPHWRAAAAHDRPERTAALILCELCLDQLGRHVLNGNSTAVNGEFLRWYQRLLQVQARQPLLQINERLGQLETVLPGAARTLKAAMAEADA